MIFILDTPPHAITCCGKPGCRSDIELIRRCGTPIEDREAEVYLVLDKEVEREIHARKKMVRQIERERTEVNLLSVSNGES